MATDYVAPRPSSRQELACINCGEANDGGFSGEDTPGPFCSSCWERLDEHFTATLRAALAQREAENKELRTAKVMAEHHKALSLMGRSSYAEVVEDELRTKLAEAELRADALASQVAQLQAEKEKEVTHWRELVNVLVYAGPTLTKELDALRAALLADPQD